MQACSLVSPTGVAGDDTVDGQGRYWYMADLFKLEKGVPSPQVVVPPYLRRVATPLRLLVWRSELSPHPDPEFRHFILRGIEHGFRIGFNYEASRCQKASHNVPSATEHPEPIEKYLANELGTGRIVGLLPGDEERVHINRFGVIPKPHQPGKWRLITDLSNPRGGSVNDGISRDLCSMAYSSVDQAVQCIIRLGRGAVLAKFDLESAYRAVPVHPHNWMLLGMSWRGKVYVDGALPFGLRSAPKLFTAVADGLLWIMGRHGVRESLHYLDDFLICDPPGSGECGGALKVSLSLCRDLVRLSHC